MNCGYDYIVVYGQDGYSTIDHLSRLCDAELDAHVFEIGGIILCISKSQLQIWGEL